MAVLIARVHNDRLHIDDNVFTVYDPDVMQAPGDDLPDFAATGLVTVTRSGPAVLCGTHLGPVSVTAELWDGAPPLDTGDWQDAAEVSLEWEGARMEVWGDGTGYDEEIPVPVPGPGAYRLRVLGRYRDEGEDRAPEGPREEFLLQLWAAPAAPVSLHKGTSRTGARRRER